MASELMNELAASVVRIGGWIAASNFGSEPHTPLDRGPNHAPWCMDCRTDWPCGKAGTR